MTFLSKFWGLFKRTDKVSYDKCSEDVFDKDDNLDKIDIPKKISIEEVEEENDKNSNMLQQKSIKNLLFWVNKYGKIPSLDDPKESFKNQNYVYLSVFWTACKLEKDFIEESDLKILLENEILKTDYNKK